MTGQHWATQYIGKAWEAGAQGPEAYDCFSLFRQVQAAHYGIEVPMVDVNANDVRDVMRAFGDGAKYGGWIEVEAPKDGDAVIMANARHPSHIGVWIEAGSQRGSLHCVYGLGVVFSSLSSLSGAGWGKLSFWRKLWA